MSREVKGARRTRIVIADDHPILRDGIRRMLDGEPDFEIVGEAGDGDAAVRLAAELLPDVILMDVGMPGMNGLEATRLIKAQHPSIVVVVLTVHDEEEYILGLLEAGAAGYLLKSAYGKELVHAVRAVRTGEMVLDATVGKSMLKRAMRQRPSQVRFSEAERLTAREFDVLRLAAAGLSNSEIAEELGIGVRTVKGHMANVFSKLRVGSRTEAVLCAVRLGWISVEGAGEDV